ncbi:MAG TPA: hypothetical protein VF899_13535 [Pyrinomonadaceae bacterium]
MTAVFAAGGNVEHTLVGSSEKVDKDGKTLVVKTAAVLAQIVTSAL